LNFILVLTCRDTGGTRCQRYIANKGKKPNTRNKKHSHQTYRKTRRETINQERTAWPEERRKMKEER
jgi:hypothetical protein